MPTCPSTEPPDTGASAPMAGEPGWVGVDPSSAWSAGATPAPVAAEPDWVGRTAPEIIGLGCIAVDEVCYADSPLNLGGKTHIISRERRTGGLTALALLAAARLGARCSYEGLLGVGQWEFTAEALRAGQVATCWAPRAADAAPVQSVIVVADDGERSIFYHDSAPMGAPEQPELNRIASAKAILVDGYGVPGSIRAATAAQQLGVGVVGDFESLSHPRTLELIDLTDHLIVSAAFARLLTGLADTDQATRTLAQTSYGKPRALVAVTDGARGVSYVVGGVNTVRHQAAFTIQAIDTTGCGDVFHGAYLAALARGDDVADRLRFASATAALLATRPANTPNRLPTRPEVDHFLASHTD